MSKPDKLKVKAADPEKPVFQPGVQRQVDKDGNDLVCIRTEWVEVPNTRFYRQRISKGDLVEFVAAPTTTDSGARRVKE